MNPTDKHTRYYFAKTEKVEAYLERVQQLDEEVEQEQLPNPSPFVIKLGERFARASEELLEAKELSATSADVLHHT